MSCVLASILVGICLTVSIHSEEPKSGAKSSACLVLIHQAVEGTPEATPRMNHFALPDPKLRARLKQSGFEVAVAPYTSGLSMEFLQQFNVVVIPHTYVPGTYSGFDEMVSEKKRLLLEYVRAGGGLLVMRVPGWQFGKDIDAANDWLKPLDIQIPGEQVVDDEYKVTLESGYKLSWTDNVSSHPATEDVKGIFYTTYHHMYSDSTSPVKAGKEWSILLRGRKTTKSLKTVKGGKPPPPSPGTFPSEPPLLAVRDYGKGHVAVWPINASCVWQDGYHILWGRGLTMERESSGMRGDGARLITNLMSWLGQPSKGQFGGYVKPKKPAAKPEVGFIKINWDKRRIKGAMMPRCFVGLIGAKSSLSSGTGTPEQFIQSAKEAGYDFIGFTEDLAKLTEDEFKKLQDICKANSSEAFKAYPGYAYLDESGNSWVTFSDRLRWPEKGWLSDKYPGRIKINNPLSRGCQWPPVVLVKSNSNPERAVYQGNFKVISLYTYENGKLVDDSVGTYLRLQKMRYQLAPVAVHLVTSPDQVLKAKSNGFQTWVRWYDDHVVDALSGHIGKYQGNYVFFRSSFVSNGPIIEDNRILNFATSDLAIPTNDRFRLHIRASSQDGLDEVEVLNSDSGRPWRRFLPDGAKEFEISLDHFHDRQYVLIVRAKDKNGKTAIGWGAWTGVQENSFPRCSDNINTMPRGKWWGQPKHLQNVRGIENYLVVRNFRYCGLPTFSPLKEFSRPAVEYYPYLASRFGTILDCIIQDHYPSTASGNPDRNDIAELAVPNEFVTGRARHTLFTPWQDGPLITLVEGDFVAKKDFELKRAEVMHFNGRQRADSFCATRADGTIVAGKITMAQRSYIGELPANGFAALFHQPFRGSVGLIALQEGLKYFAFTGGKEWYHLRGQLQDDDRTVKAGEKLTYRYLGVMSKLDPPPDIRFITNILDTLGLRGKTAYRIDPSIGFVSDDRFVLKLQAQDFGFAGKITQAKLPLNLPVEIEGLNPRWHAAIWYKGRNTFVLPEWVVNDMNQRYTVRRNRAIVNELRAFPVLEEGNGIVQIDTEIGDKEIFIGNLLTSDNPNVYLTLVDTRPQKAAFVIHNPTDETVECEVRNASGFTLMGNFATKTKVNPGSSLKVMVPHK